MTNFLSKDVWFKIGLLIIFIGVVFSSFYKLRESPPTWTDEGLIIQTSQNLAGQGVYGFQIGPGNIISPSFISTSYPVTYPIALFFRLFGVSLFNARIVMVLYIISLFLAVFFLFKKEGKEKLIWTLLLIGSFPPLYGHGKNVLGEIPGLFFILLSALFLRSIEEKRGKLSSWFFFGLFSGLAVATKPIFILVIPAFLFVIFKIYSREENIDLKRLGVLFLAFVLPILTWLYVQFFPTDGWSAVIHYYSNPHSVDIIPAIILNLKDFLAHVRTLFAGGVFGIWSITIAYSYYKNKKVTLFEIYLYIISLIVFVLYFRNPPYYRYFFITEALSIIFLTQNLFRFHHDRFLIKNIIRLFLCLLFIFQFYQLNFNSWVADSYKSIKTETMQYVIEAIPSNKTVFFYQAPEAVIFLRHFNYYQYFSGTITTEFGQENLHFIKDNNNLLIITKKEVFLQKKDLFSGYKITQEFDRYVVLQK